MTSHPLWTEGDSLMAGAYGVNLNELIDTATGRDCVNTSAGGSSMVMIRDRILANPAYADRTLIVWDGSEFPDYTDVTTYCDTLETALTSLGHYRFIIIPPSPLYLGDPSVVIAIRTEMLARWPGNVLDWRQWIANADGALQLDRMASYPPDTTHMNLLAMTEMTNGVLAFLSMLEGLTAFQPNAFQHSAFQIDAQQAQAYAAFCTPQPAGRSVVQMTGY